MVMVMGYARIVCALGSETCLKGTKKINKQTAARRIRRRDEIVYTEQTVWLVGKKTRNISPGRVRGN